eukprot:m.458509 g.458509  ORF g.458509 m.458509 type:complete len:319 (+) comp20337_c2_seq12:307-1263(+)
MHTRQHAQSHSHREDQVVIMRGMVTAREDAAAAAAATSTTMMDTLDTAPAAGPGEAPLYPATLSRRKSSSLKRKMCEAAVAARLQNGDEDDDGSDDDVTGVPLRTMAIGDSKRFRCQLSHFNRHHQQGFTGPARAMYEHATQALASCAGTSHRHHHQPHHHHHTHHHQPHQQQHHLAHHQQPSAVPRGGVDGVMVGLCDDVRKCLGDTPAAYRSLEGLLAAARDCLPLLVAAPAVAMDAAAASLSTTVTAVLRAHKLACCGIDLDKLRHLQDVVAGLHARLVTGHGIGSLDKALAYLHKLVESEHSMMASAPAFCRPV